jgi:hypothetical protein
MSNIYKKQQHEEVIEQVPELTHIPSMVIQSTLQSTIPIIPFNKRYIQLNSIFQRFSARACYVSQSEFNKMLASFKLITELSESNQTNDYFNLLTMQDAQESDLVDLDMSVQKEAIDETSPSQIPEVTTYQQHQEETAETETQKTKTKSCAPWILGKCLNPIGMP